MVTGMANGHGGKIGCGVGFEGPLFLLLLLFDCLSPARLRALSLQWRSWRRVQNYEDVSLLFLFCCLGGLFVVLEVFGGVDANALGPLEGGKWQHTWK